METWEKEKTWECFSSGERGIYFCGHLFSRCGNGVKCVKLPDNKETQSAVIVGTADVEEDPVLAFTVDAAATSDLKNVLFTSHKSGMVRVWSGADLECSEVLRCDHRGPISLLLAGSPFLVTASADLTLKLWNVENRHCEGILRGCSGVPLSLSWATISDDSKKYIVSGQVDGKVTVWDAEAYQSPTAVLDKHRSQISAVANDKSQDLLITCGRDQLIAFWSMKDFSCLRVMPSFEEIEILLPVSSEFSLWLVGKKSKSLIDVESSYCLSAGEKGKLRLWNLNKMGEVGIENIPLEKSLVASGRKIDTIHVENRILYLAQDDTIGQYDVKTSSLLSVTCSNQYEVLAFALVNPHYLVVASGSPDVKVYNLETNALTIGVGHSDAVLAVASCQDEKSNFISCGKDQTVSYWKLTTVDDKNVKLELIARGSGHSSYVGALALSEDHIYSASKDGVLKLWKRPNASSETVQELHTIRTVLAHNQDINSIDISGDFLATASQDKTCKIWNASDLSLLTTLSGHRRGIWCCRFVGRKVVTASADCTIKVWETNHFTCLHTLEGHLSSVLSICVLDNESKLASVSSDGLLKIWSSETSESVGSFDAHDDKIWAVESWNKKIVTGGRDGQMIMWRNITEQVKAEERKKTDEQVRTDQKLQNYLANGKLEKALALSIRLDRPRQTRKTLDLLRKRSRLESALAGLNLDDRNALFRMLVQWNSIGTFSTLAQEVLKHLLQEALVNGRPLASDKCAGIISFSEKHYQRLDKLESRLAVVDLMLQKM